MYYPTAKAINKVNIMEQRTDKKINRVSRVKKSSENHSLRNDGPQKDQIYKVETDYPQML